MKTMFEKLTAVFNKVKCNCSNQQCACESCSCGESCTGKGCTCGCNCCK